MRKLVAAEFMTLDGVMQAPGSPDEDRSGGFDQGGWQLSYFDDVFARTIMEGLAETGGFLLGRRTYEIFAAHWPNAPDEQQILAEPLNTMPKYVASTTLAEPLEWQNATLLRGDIADAVDALKAEQGKDLHVIGSPRLVQTLIEHDLIDELQLMIDPIVVGGGGKRLFGDDGPRRSLRLVESRPTSTGAIIATYAKEETT
jgi:dihydrofolate reductase